MEKLVKRKVIENQSLDFILSQLMAGIIEGVSPLNCIITSELHKDCFIKIVESNLEQEIMKFVVLNTEFNNELNIDFPVNNENEDISGCVEIYTPVIFKTYIDDSGKKGVYVLSLEELQLEIKNLLTDESGVNNLNQENWEMDKKIWNVYELSLETKN